MIPDEAVELALIANWDTEGDQRERMRAALEAAAPHMLAGARKLIQELTDPEECWFDHSGGCQAHGYLDLKSGEKCPQADAKEWAK